MKTNYAYRIYIRDIKDCFDLCGMWINEKPKMNTGSGPSVIVVSFSKLPSIQCHGRKYVQTINDNQAESCEIYKTEKKWRKK